MKKETQHNRPALGDAKQGQVHAHSQAASPCGRSGLANWALRSGGGALTSDTGRADRTRRARALGRT